MGLTRQGSRRFARVAAQATTAALLCGLLPGAMTRGGTDTTPPVGSVTTIVQDDAYQTATLTLAYSDPESGLDHVTVSCGDAVVPPLSVPYASPITVSLHGADSAGCVAYGPRSIRVEIWNGAGLSAGSWQGVLVSPLSGFDLPLPAVTGQPFTVQPRFASDFVIAPTDVCRWELRWGSTHALRTNTADETFGGLLFEGPASRGFCGPWTFTLPWVPVRQFQVTFDYGPESGYSMYGTRRGFDGDPFITASLGSTDRRIVASNLALAYVLPNSYNLIVGEAITYRLYSIGIPGVTGTWSAHPVGAQSISDLRTQVGGTTFTFVPHRTGSWLVGWDISSASRYRVGDYYDPKARYPDSVRPRTTVPVERVASGLVSATVPATISWSGSDVGWGIGRYQIQRSIDGAAYRSVSLASPRATVLKLGLAPGHSYRFRVRAIDQAGNVGLWSVGPSFRVLVRSESSGAITYTGTWLASADPTAGGGTVKVATAAGARARLVVTGRDVAWIAPRGPGYGRADVYVDGVRVATVDLGAASPAARSVVWRRHWTSVGTHTIQIRVRGTADRPAVGLDGFVVLR